MPTQDRDDSKIDEALWLVWRDRKRARERLHSARMKRFASNASWVVGIIVLAAVAVWRFA
jgi:hypothetical protein